MDARGEVVDGPPKRRFAALSARLQPGPAGAAHAPLLDAIAANPDEVSAWAVYADLLQTDDDPRGELISLMLERERQPSTRLFEIQRGMLAAHAKALLPAALPPEAVVGWRRGFASELVLAAPEQLAAVAREPSLRFVEAATLVIEPECWPDWRAALAATRVPWRRLDVDATRADAPLELAALLACCPAVEQLRVVRPQGSEPSWDGARAEQLRLLVLVDADTVAALHGAHLPRLEELRLLGTSVASDELRASVLWSRLQRVVLARGGLPDDDGPSLHVLAPLAQPDVGDDGDDDDDGYDDDDDRRPANPTIAFVVVGRPVEPALLRKLAGRMSIPQLSARIATPRGLPRTTVIQLFGTPEAELLPYGLAVALHNVLDNTPIALVEVEGERAARYLVLGEPAVRGTPARAIAEVQRALDLALGCDHGTGVLEEVRVALGTTPVVPLVGDGGTCQLVMVDPATAPLVVQDDDDATDYEDDEDYGGDDDDGDDWQLDDGAADQYEEPPPVEDDVDDVPNAGVPAPKAATAVAAAASAVPAEDLEGEAVDAPVIEELPAVPEDDDDPAVASTHDDDEDALASPPERLELWLDFREHWDDRAVDVDDEPGELRWPDPERAGDLVWVLEHQVAEPACVRHECALDHCDACGARYCVECADEDRCRACAAADRAPQSASPK